MQSIKKDNMKLNFFQAVFFLTAVFSLSSAADLVSDVKCQQRCKVSATLALEFGSGLQLYDYENYCENYAGL